MKHYMAGALDLATGTLHHCVGRRKTNGLFRDLLQTLEATYPPRSTNGSMSWSITIRSIRRRLSRAGWRTIRA